ncbi:hypothetical protein ACHAW5_001429 [Stephanodiscus triporus]|uniref:SLC26A/SulP transporter domain-containing protein n=1 Tax=Stephanodiscus triporus TaxID=2934178 RepID=A0ABD3R076_9STRA
MVAPKFDPIRDLISGMIMAATSVPQLIAYAETAGYAGHRGLSTAGMPLLAWGLVTGSPWTNAGVTSLTALMARNDLVPGEKYDEYVSTHGGEEGYVYLVSSYSLWVGLSSVLLALFGFGEYARNNVPESVRSGFKWGCEAGVLASALPGGLYHRGMRGTPNLLSSVADSTVGRIASALRRALPGAAGAAGVANLAYASTHPWTWDLDAVFVFVNCVGFMYLARDYLLPNFVPVGSEVAFATIAATLFSVLCDYEGDVVGEMPSSSSSSSGESSYGFSLFDGYVVKLPPIDFLDVRRLLDVPIAERCFDGSTLKLLLTASVFSAVNYLGIVAIASGYERDDGVPWSATRELLAQGSSNIVAGLVGSAPISGSMSRSLIGRMTGASSRFACVVTALIWIFTMPYMSAMGRTPKSALSAVIVTAVAKNVIYPSKLLALRGPDLFVGLMTAVSAAVISPTMGFVLGCVLHFSVRMGMESKKKVA